MAAPPPNVKCMMIFESGTGYGWTETHWLSNNANPPPLAVSLATLNSVAAMRAPLLGALATVVGTRVSAKVGNVIQSLPGNPMGHGTAGEPSSSQNDSIACQMINATNNRKKIIHLRGPWDSVIANEQYNPGAGGGAFDTFLTTYLAALINKGFGWTGKDPANSLQGSVVGYVQNADDSVTFTVITDNGTPLLSSLIGGTNPLTWEVRFSKLNYSHSVLNRSFVCTLNYVAGPPVVQTITTVGPVATGPFIAKGRFNLVFPAFVGYANIGLRSLGERRMGRPLGKYPGRSRRRATI